MVEVYEQGSFVMWLCLEPTEPLPDDDLVAMHKLMITANETEYLRKAEPHRPRR